MSDNWVIVADSSSRLAISERALVLQSLRITHNIVEGEFRYMLAVPEHEAERARAELRAYSEENLKAPARPIPVAIDYHNAIPGLIAYVAIVCGVAWLAGQQTFGYNWFAAGRIDGALFRDGEVWRTITALTLHSGLKHILANLGFGALFVFFACRLAGSGIAGFTILIASAAGNAANTLLLDAAHRSLGASTAVFAALGLTAGFVWRAKLMRQDRWPLRWGPLVGGFALLAFTGTGDANTDIGAHVAGFAMGMAGGLLLTMITPLLANLRVQTAAGLSSLCVLLASWYLALSPGGID